MTGNEQRGAKRTDVSPDGNGQVTEIGLPPVDQTVARNFLNLLRSVRGPLNLGGRYHFQSTPELETRITEVLDAACAQVPGINRTSLDTIIRQDPYAYPKWPVSARRRNPDMDWTLILDFPQLAAYWGNNIYDREMAIA